ncbi:hypothetical protein JRO89_XS15G0157200 [Xanthoceras sorbifolium]|uniref:Uncharacterized protein n=1 Tax=Xanthoceras sorbifolium TaxID=99658 RepID=A0ABQ8H2F0_9ROSI|nr:hypothetical protein JRO89_XS15G0157200 [Xanthoceras sorbifolium]
MPCLQQIKIIFFFFDSQSSSRQLGFVYDRVAKYCSQVFKTSILTQNTVFFCGPAANKFLFSNEDKHVNIWYPSSVKKILLPSATQRSSTEESKQTRKLLPNFLKPEAHQRHGFYCTGAFRVLLSVEDPQRVARFADHFNSLTAGIISLPIDFPGTPFNKAIRTSMELRKELLALIKQRKIDLEQNRASPTQDL